jgi:hypothetical protein
MAAKMSYLSERNTGSLSGPSSGALSGYSSWPISVDPQYGWTELYDPGSVPGDTFGIGAGARQPYVGDNSLVV